MTNPREHDLEALALRAVADPMGARDEVERVCCELAGVNPDAVARLRAIVGGGAVPIRRRAVRSVADVLASVLGGADS